MERAHIIAFQLTKSEVTEAAHQSYQTAKREFMTV